jgi:hypothetical protein
VLTALGAGFRSVGRNWGLVLLVLFGNLAFALVVAVPLAPQLEGDLAHLGVSRGMMCGFDFDWWAQWSERQERPPSTILGLGALYLVMQVFLTGGLLGVFRTPAGGWTVRGLLHGSGFYFGRLFRVSLLALAAAAVVFGLNAPFARWVDGLAREAVSERTAIALTLGRHALLLLAFVLVHMVSSHAKILVVREERLSSVLAFLSSFGFCKRNLLRALGQYAVVLVLGAGVVAVFGALDRHLEVIGWKTQTLALVLFQAVVVARIALRLGLLAGQVELQRAGSVGTLR